ncbi:thermospermine synthase ACAULIS5 [Physcomitrium patens]|nr:thermospermine synthase ACAULIS5-like [Physcomitrium patens]|eukprot:XP_024398973.1 thermospermine synthase ACAULIS5-like [Physcomitrella patens]
MTKKNFKQALLKDVVPYAAHAPSYADTWGWIMVSKALPLENDTTGISCIKPTNPSNQSRETDIKIKQRIDGELKFLDGQALSAMIGLNKHVGKSLATERSVYTEEAARFIHGHETAVK